MTNILTPTTFCEGFFHISECFEWKQSPKCLFNDNCDKGDLVLTLYLTYQPCHHSLGTRYLKGDHKQSCCELLHAWYKTVLEPLNVKLVIKCCDLYRIHWEDENLFRSLQDCDLFKKRTFGARSGIYQLMKEKMILIESMHDDDWKYLLSLCENNIAISQDKWNDRIKHDKKISEFLQVLKLECQTK